MYIYQQSNMSIRIASPKKNSLIKYRDPECPRAVFNKGRKIAGLDPIEYRLCHITGRIICFSHYGLFTEFGWHEDHFIPLAQNGSDFICNLIPVYYKINLSQGQSMKYKPKAIILRNEALAEKRGIQRKYKNLDFKWSDDLIGSVVWVKETPCSLQKTAKIVSYDKKWVLLVWVDSGFSGKVPLDKDLFEIL